MKPAPFEYVAPDSVEATLATLAQHGYEAKLLAGGQSLIPTMNFRLPQPAILVDINGVHELSGIKPTQSGGVMVGALTRQRHVEHSRLVAEQVPMLAEAIQLVAHPQIRNRGTIGGSLAHADPAAELPVVAVALEATVHVDGPEGPRAVPAVGFFQGLFTVDLGPEELLTAVEFPPARPGSGTAFLELARRHGDFALAGVAALVGLDVAGRCEFARLVYLNVGDVPTVASAAADMLVGEVITDSLIEAAAVQASSAEMDPAGNIHASAEYQRHLARVLTQRALRSASERSRMKMGE